MTRSSAFLVVLALLAVQAAATAYGAPVRQHEQVPEPTPLDDPYVPPAGDPDIFAPEDAPGDEPSPLNPADD